MRCLSLEQRPIVPLSHGNYYNAICPVLFGCEGKGGEEEAREGA